MVNMTMRKVGARVGLGLLALLLTPFLTGPGVPVFAATPAMTSSCVTPYDHIVVTNSVTFCAGSYKFQDKSNQGAIIIGADNVVVDGTGVTLNGASGSGYGIYLNLHTGVTLKNFNISGYYDGIRIESASNATVTNNIVSKNGGVAQQSYNINVTLSQDYGGGILADNTVASTFSGNTGTSENVGIDFYNSGASGTTGNTISANNFSSTYGWGIRLDTSSYNTLTNNQANNVSGCRGTHCSSRDTAGILLVNSSDDNTVSNNTIRYGGDGFFIGNQYSTTSDNNIVSGNDGSHAIHNCFEATFGKGNSFTNNTADNCAYGFWLGYARNVVVQNNTVESNSTDGVSIPNGCAGTFTGNSLENNGQYGLWMSGAPSNDVSWPCGSYPYNDHVVTGNTISGNGSAGVYLGDTTYSQIGTSTSPANNISGNPDGIYVTGASVTTTANYNDLPCSAPCTYSVYNAMASAFNAEYNYWGGTPLVYGPVDTSYALTSVR